MYLALRQPWASHGTPPADAGVVAAAPADGGVKKSPKKRVKRRPPVGGNSGGGNIVAGGEDGWGSADYVEETEPQLVALTPADRALEWRGDDTSPPKQTIDMTSGKESRPLDDGEIRAVIESQSGGVQSCVVQGATNTNLSGTITVRMIVDGSGHVTKSKLQAPHYMHEHGLLSCVKGALTRMHFPSTGAATLVTMPINLT
ncbi:MAG: hypothetical protein JWO36_4861 [Myxococcales bacterium]|nr:hypothetical protein [Myxococcales bacterium]